MENNKAEIEIGRKVIENVNDLMRLTLKLSKRLRLLRVTVRRQQNEIEKYRSFLRDCNMLDYYENSFENYPMVGMDSKCAQNPPIIEEGEKWRITDV